ncbi:hypothetical protein C8T65DRAFT_168435 [Cerioporus squamosus]|nr:hypothetical protein C8T65DRAFT_168435 [Cerioporus squamosus]
MPEHLLRLTSLTVHWSMVFPKDVQRRLLAMGPLLVLEHLQLTCDLPAPESNFLDLEAAGLAGSAPRADDCPQLRYLGVNPDFFVPSMVVPSLRTLAIYRGHIKFEVFMSALVNCPALESLHLDHADFWDIRAPAQHVVLARLRNLSLNYLDSFLIRVHDMFRYIRFPSISRLTAFLGDCALIGVIPEPYPSPSCVPSPDS